MKNQNDKSNNGATAGSVFIGMLTIAFIVLKLVGVIDWSWLWVLSPIWLTTVPILAVIAIWTVVVLIRIIKIWRGGGSSE